MRNSRVYYGNTFLDDKDLEDTDIKNKIELEYYKIKKYHPHSLKRNSTVYGIEIVKKEYLEKKVNIEKHKIDKVSNIPSKIDLIIEKLKEFKVTPIGLEDVLEDLAEN